MPQSPAKATDEETAPLLGHVVGENLKRLRATAGLTQQQAARLLQANGVRWSRSHVAAFEAGDREVVDVGVLTLIARAFEVPPAELLDGDGPIRITPEATWTRAALREMLTAGETDEALTLIGQALRMAVEAAGGEHVLVNPLQADIDLAMRMGVRPELVTQAAERLWGHPLQAERDRRLAEMEPMTEAQRRTRRGHITRKLTREIEPHLGEEHG
ncbi:helix-turn-helix domain-containing protein [Microbispora bryophytorum]|uniref:helix-turn-helix domain-containing protein n=1 Tax=Microbispora bryophytorum TaxID=1460882 RepID=UPI0033ED467F